MKILLSLIFFLSISINFAQNYTEWMNPKPFPNIPRGIFFLDEDIGWIVGYNSSIVKTTDAGKSWTEQIAPPGDYKMIYFISAKVGWLIGQKENSNDGLVAFTSDGGNTWLDVWPSGYRDFSIKDIFVKDDSTAYICSLNGVFKTSDKGNTWIYLLDKSTNTVHYVNNTEGFIGNDGGEIMRTCDSGYNWKPVYKIHHGFINKIKFINEKEGYAVGGKYLFGLAKYSKGLILKTVDAGNTWAVVDSSENHNSNFIDIVFQDKKPYDILAVDQNGENYFYRPTNRSWSKIDNYSGYKINYNGVSYSKNRCYLVGQISSNIGRDYYSLPLLVYTTNLHEAGYGVYSNNRFNVVTKYGISDIKFINNETGWVVGGEGTLLKTVDAGENWENYKIFSFDIKYLACPSINIVFATGENKLVSSVDGGKNWKVIQSPKLIDISGIHFINEKEGFILRNDRKTLRTIDGGDNWTEISIQATSINSYDNNTLWAIENHHYDDYEESYFYRTTDGGRTWKDSTHFTDLINSISFIDEKNGWLAESSTIRRTFDGGTTWEIIFQPSENSRIISFYVVSNNIGFMLVDSGIGGVNYNLFISYDGGKSFQSIKKIAKIDKLYYGPSSYGWGIGPTGNIIRINHKNFFD